MKKSVALLTIHGMGETARSYADGLHDEIKAQLGAQYEYLHFGSVYYQYILQKNENRVWARLDNKLGWPKLRKFVLYGLGDAAGLEARKERNDGIYTLSQIEIAKGLYDAYKVLSPGANVVVVAQSLGGQLFSNYLWDAQKQSAGLWKNPQQYAGLIADKRNFMPDELRFLAGGGLRALYTTGCNIPIFVAAHALEHILPFDPPTTVFEWHNFYDNDDVLGWPLAPLSEPYTRMVSDHRINAGRGIRGWLLKSWNPLSHEEYWKDGNVLNPLATLLRSMIAGGNDAG